MTGNFSDSQPLNYTESFVFELQMQRETIASQTKDFLQVNMQNTLLLPFSCK